MSKIRFPDLVIPKVLNLTSKSKIEYEQPNYTENYDNSTDYDSEDYSDVSILQNKVDEIDENELGYCHKQGSEAYKKYYLFVFSAGYALPLIVIGKGFNWIQFIHLCNVNM